MKGLKQVGKMWLMKEGRARDAINHESMAETRKHLFGDAGEVF